MTWDPENGPRLPECPTCHGVGNHMWPCVDDEGRMRPVCEGCGKFRNSLKTMALSSDDTIALCFVCIKESGRGRHYDFAQKKYVSPDLGDDE